MCVCVSVCLCLCCPALRFLWCFEKVCKMLMKSVKLNIEKTRKNIQPTSQQNSKPSARQPLNKCSTALGCHHFLQVLNYLQPASSSQGQPGAARYTPNSASSKEPTTKVGPSLRICMCFQILQNPGDRTIFQKKKNGICRNPPFMSQT